MQNVDGKQSTLKPTDKIVICADLDLLEFPLESLKLIHSNAGVGSVSINVLNIFVYLLKSINFQS